MGHVNNTKMKRQNKHEKKELLTDGLSRIQVEGRKINLCIYITASVYLFKKKLIKFF